MARLPGSATRQYIFRPTRLWPWLNSGILLIAGLGFLFVSIRAHQPWWLGGSFLSVICICARLCDYSTRRLIIRDHNLIYQYGLLAARQRVLPLWRISLETRQTLLGRLLDYGMVVLYIDDEVLQIHQIARIAQFRNLLIREQDDLMEYRSNFWLR